jgi:hypothetical protein
LFYVFDWQTNRRVDVRLYHWESQPRKESLKK